jgi:hypothetical protein
MSNKHNDILMDYAIETAQSEFDATAPDEIVMARAKEIFEILIQKDPPSEPSEPEDWDLVDCMHDGLCSPDEDLSLGGEDEY